jgi:hypothetical protein
MLDNEELAKKKKKKRRRPHFPQFQWDPIVLWSPFFSLSLIRPLLVPHNRHTKFFLFLLKRKENNAAAQKEEEEVGKRRRSMNPRAARKFQISFDLLQK